MLGNKTYKIINEIKGQKCLKCSHERKFKIVEEKKWFVLLFLPLFVYKKRKLLVCSVCGAAYEFKQSPEVLPEENAAFDDHKLYEGIKARFDKGEITKNEYIRMCNIIKYKSRDTI